MEMVTTKTIQLKLTEDEILDCIIDKYIQCASNEDIELVSKYDSIGEYNFKLTIIEED